MEKNTQYDPFNANVFALGASLWELALLAQPTALQNNDNLKISVKYGVAKLNFFKLC